MRVGIVANEFFDPLNGRVGGFGWAAREAARALAARGDEVVFLSGEVHERTVGRRAELHGIPLVPVRRSRLVHLAALRRARPDLLLAIDFRPGYLPVLRALPGVPLLVWVRDPRHPDDTARLRTLRLPGSDAPPEGVAPIDCTALGRLVRRGRRRIVLGGPAPSLLTPRAAAAYDIEGLELAFLPNPIPLDVPEGPEHPTPRAVFLARLDPVKRPWVVVEVARRMPHVEFVFLGRAHFSGPGTWTPEDLPPNVRMAGHLDGEEKQRVLASAWVLVNTALHEGLPVSYLEACAARTPIVSGVDPGGLASRFGFAVGVAPGDGLESVPAYVEALERLIGDERERRRLAGAAREWVTAHHGREHFLEAFDELAAQAGAGRRRRARSTR